MRWTNQVLAVGLVLLAACGADTTETSDLADARFAAKWCSPPRAQCNGRCVDLQTDSWNCGACGNVCEGVSPCVDGACPYSCNLTCPAGMHCCWVPRLRVAAHFVCAEDSRTDYCGFKNSGPR